MFCIGLQFKGLLYDKHLTERILSLIISFVIGVLKLGRNYLVGGRRFEENEIKETIEFSVYSLIEWGGVCCRMVKQKSLYII